MSGSDEYYTPEQIEANKKFERATLLRDYNNAISDYYRLSKLMSEGILAQRDSANDNFDVSTRLLNKSFNFKVKLESDYLTGPQEELNTARDAILRRYPENDGGAALAALTAAQTAAQTAYKSDTTDAKKQAMDDADADLATYNAITVYREAQTAYISDTTDAKKQAMDDAKTDLDAKLIASDDNVAKKQLIFDGAQLEEAAVNQKLDGEYNDYKANLESGATQLDQPDWEENVVGVNSGGYEPTYYQFYYVNEYGFKNKHSLMGNVSSDINATCKPDPETTNYIFDVNNPIISTELSEYKEGAPLENINVRCDTAGKVVKKPGDTFAWVDAAGYKHEYPDAETWKFRHVSCGDEETAKEISNDEFDAIPTGDVMGIGDQCIPLDPDRKKELDDLLAKIESMASQLGITIDIEELKKNNSFLHSGMSGTSTNNGMSGSNGMSGGYSSNRQSGSGTIPENITLNAGVDSTRDVFVESKSTLLLGYISVVVLIIAIFYITNVDGLEIITIIMIIIFSILYFVYDVL
jgi:hypothetical protein